MISQSCRDKHTCLLEGNLMILMNLLFEEVSLKFVLLHVHGVGYVRLG